MMIVARTAATTVDVKRWRDNPTSENPSRRTSVPSNKAIMPAPAPAALSATVSAGVKSIGGSCPAVSGSVAGEGGGDWMCVGSVRITNATGTKIHRIAATAVMSHTVVSGSRSPRRGRPRMLRGRKQPDSAAMVSDVTLIAARIAYCRIDSAGVGAVVTGGVVIAAAEKIDIAPIALRVLRRARGNRRACRAREHFTRLPLCRCMSTILDEIIENKRHEVAQRKTSRPLEELRETITTLGRPRNFFHAVTKKPGNKSLNLIAEIKKASPSAGVIRADFDPIKIAQAYALAGADALSVLTDEKYFQGHLDYLHAIRDVVKLPVLRKDFIIDPYQVYESRAFGADAILLIAECLETSEMIDLQILATELNLTCLIEVHDMDNLMRVRDHVIGFPHRSYSLLGINNRNLKTFKVDLGNTLRL